MDIFEADITAICRIIYAVDMVAGIVVAYRWLKFNGVPSNNLRRENYLAALDAYLKELSSLGPEKIDAIMDFYTFLRGARDAVLSFNNWVNGNGDIRESYSDMLRRADVVHMAYLLFASLESAQRACTALMEKSDELRVTAELSNRLPTNAVPDSLAGLVLYKYLYVRMIEKMKILLLWFLDNTISTDAAEDERRFWIELRFKSENLRQHPAFIDSQNK